MKGREYRQMRVVPIISEEKEGRIVADIVQYNVLDDYGTTFQPGVFTESLSTRMPRICWGHDWKDPIGQWVDAEDNNQRLRMVGELDLETRDGQLLVPSAHRAFAQMNSGTIDQFSVGFVRQSDKRGAKPGTFDIVKALLDEASPVLIGSVPGTKLISIRAASGAPRLTRAGLPAGSVLYVPSDVVQDLIVRFERGELDLGDAIQELKRTSLTFDELPQPDTTAGDDEDDEDDENLEDEQEEEEVPEIPEDLDAALAALGIELNA
jgi:HK97 family phage prohead protease